MATPPVSGSKSKKRSSISKRCASHSEVRNGVTCDGPVELVKVDFLKHKFWSLSL